MYKKYQKLGYRLRNWSEYNKSLTGRGSLTLWISPDVERTWFAEPARANGRPTTYSDAAMTAIACIRAVMCLPLRPTQGFLESFFRRIGSRLPVPHYTTIARRLGSLKVDFRPFAAAEGPIDIVIDSTGIKVFGEGEWKVRQHGASKRRTWKKLHLAVDAKTHEIVAAEVTENNVHDCSVVDELLSQIPGEIRSIAADGAYDTEWCYFLTAERGAKSLVSLRKNAARWKDDSVGRRLRNANFDRVMEIGSTSWKVESWYHRRSLAETAMYRMKVAFGDRVASRRTDRQKAELLIRVKALNEFTRLGMPDRYLIPDKFGLAA